MKPSLNGCGRRNSSIFSPSKGDTGIRLKSISTRLITMKVNRKDTGVGKYEAGEVLGTKPVLSTRAPVIAINKLLAGPANETHMRADRECWRSFHGLTGTGFAHPNPATKRSRLPIKSKCFNGFKVNLPALRGVSSPNRSATNACENSWTVRATKSVAILEMRRAGERLSITPFWRM